MGVPIGKLLLGARVLGHSSCETLGDSVPGTSNGSVCNDLPSSSVFCAGEDGHSGLQVNNHLGMFLFELYNTVNSLSIIVGL